MKTVKGDRGRIRQSTEDFRAVKVPAWCYNGGMCCYTFAIQTHTVYHTKSKPAWKLWILGDDDDVTNVLLWWGMLIMKEAINVGGGTIAPPVVLSYRKSLYFVLNFVMNLKLLWKIRPILKYSWIFIIYRYCLESKNGF
jgi:hypothetical protein